jgi:serine/threonine-protein kinase
VHRDIKPENVLFDVGRTLLCDFGIARALVAASGDRITSAGYAVGTPSYMSPEQAHDAEISARTDLYALGCVVFEMLTGDPPFTGPTPQAIIARHLSQAPRSIRIVRPDIPGHAEAAVKAAMAKAPVERPATATEFLRRFIGDL